MGLQEKLREFKTQFESGAPPFNVSPEVVAAFHRATDELRASGILEGILKVGDRAPEFSLPNAQGDTVNSHELLSKGTLIVTFYRGVW